MPNRVTVQLVVFSIKSAASAKERFVLSDELKQRARRLVSGSFSATDLDRLYLGLRDNAQQHLSVREIGDFIAHRDKRHQGIATETGRDIFISVNIWSMGLRSLSPSAADIARAARVNLRLATDEQILAGCGCTRATATTRLHRALTKAERGQALKESEHAALSYFGNRFIWRPAFDSDRLTTELGQVLVARQLIEKEDMPQLRAARCKLSLHALAAMHGARIKVDDNTTVELFAGFANRMRHLEVKTCFVFHELGKPLMIPVCLFLTDLSPDTHCDDDLLSRDDPLMFDHWRDPIEVGTNGRLGRLH
jgi:hypothetical protein